MDADEREKRQWLAELSLLVEDSLLVELKAVQSLEPIHTAQCLNDLRASGLHLCLLINFGRPKVEVKRFVNG